MKAVKLKIGAELYEVPTEITVQGFYEISSLDPLNPKHIPWIAHHLIGVLPDVVGQASREDLLWLVGVLLKPLEPLETLKGTHGDMRLSIGQFADLDVLTAEGVRENLISILEILAPDSLPSDPITQHWQSILDWLEYRKWIYKQYPNLWDGSGSGEATGASETPGVRHVWYELLATLAGDRYLDLEPVSSTPVISALNWLARLKSVRDRERAAHKKALAKLKNKR